MKIDLVLRMNIDDPSSGKLRRFAKEVSAELPHVPRVGEVVRLPGKNPSEYLGARRVEDVIYSLYGPVTLDFKFDGLFNDVEDQVRIFTEHGYEEAAG